MGEILVLAEHRKGELREVHMRCSLWLIGLQMRTRWM